MSKINRMSLGGLNENGKNLYTISINSKILIFDCGMKYAPDKMYGVDYVIPDFSYLIEHKKDIVGIFISHPHHENMGALTDLIKVLPEINIYASNFTSKIIEYMYSNFCHKVQGEEQDNEKKSGTNLISCPYDLYDVECSNSCARV